MLSRSGFSWDENKKMIQCEKQQYEAHCKDHNEAKGLYGESFPYFERLAAIYSKDIATGEGAEGFGEAITNLENEIIVEGEENEEENRMSREAPRWSVDSCSTSATTSSKRQKKDTMSRKETRPSDPFLVMLGDVNNQLNVVTHHIGATGTAVEHEAILQEKVMQEKPQQKFKEKAINELVRLSFIGSEIVNAATIFAKASEQMHMMLALLETLRREYVVMLNDEANRR